MLLHLEKKLIRRQKLGNLRQLKIVPPLIDFSSNDYLGLARSTKLSAAVFQEWEKHRSTFNGMGSTGSRLLTGNSLYAQNLEEKIAAFHGYETAVLFSCGYMANVGLLSVVMCRESVIFFDAAVHASIKDGIRLSGAQAFPFRHNDLNHLESRLKKGSFVENRFICIESVYSTDGSQAPLTPICQLASKYGAHVIVDEAHAVGVFGPKGAGLVREYHVEDQIFAQIVTFGKALGTYGAAVLGNQLLKQTMINFATSYIYTTALPFQMLAAVNCSYDLFPGMKAERHHLKKLIQSFHNMHPISMTPIQPISISGNEAVKGAAQELANRGFDIRPLLSPTIQRGQEILRICLHAFNTESELSQLFAAFKRCASHE